ncbi:MAG: bifunctional phosphoribosylaminoimidazolecarboxamide formyltransferase/IMP cyclohydrolase [bacterium]
MKKIARALISVYDKTGVVELASFLAKRGVEIVATSGTQKNLEKNGVKTVEMTAFAGSPELLGGEIKTLHPAVFASLMADPEEPQAMEQLQTIGGKSIQLLIVNPLPLEPVDAPVKGKHSRPVVSIDVGSVAMICAAARNHENLVILVNPAQYAPFMEAFTASEGKIPESIVRSYALQAYEMVADYNIRLYEHFYKKTGKEQFPPETLYLRYKKAMELKYGENPHQKAAFYRQPDTTGISLCDLELLQGPPMSFNNLNDVNAALEIALEFDRETAVVVKHGNPTGVAIDKDPCKAYIKARDADKVSAFGAVVAFTGQVDKKTAKELENAYTEVLLAPKITDGAMELLKASKKTANMRIYKVNIKKWVKNQKEPELRSVMGGIILQERDDLLVPDGGQIKVVSKRKPTRKQLADLVLAWKVCKYVRSNAIVIVKDGQTLGIGAGQMSRLDSIKIALEKAGENAVGAVMASDAYFPFRNVVDEAAQYGIAAIIQPGGARRDDEIMMACDEHNVALCLTGMRHFRH